MLYPAFILGKEWIVQFLFHGAIAMLGHKSLSGHQPIMARYRLKIVCPDIFSAS